ncbi:MAG: hypothetical protein IBX44_02495 [Sulfurospirillum sp.]|nr:hypothetical protein [Sulfurospirillum sp.]
MGKRIKEIQNEAISAYPNPSFGTEKKISVALKKSTSMMISFFILEL